MATTSTQRRTIRVHAAERSTDQELLGPYAETIAVVVALVGVLAAAWVVATPDATADLPLAEPAPVAVPEVYAVNRTSDSTTDVLWADPFAAPVATAVTVIEPASAPGEPAEPAAPALG